MLAEILTRYAHFIFILIMTSTLIGEALLVKPLMTRAELKTMAKLDGLYGLSAVLLVAAGLTLWLGVGKPAEYYTKNPVFHLKLTLAVVIGLISIYPTVFYIKKSRGKDLEAQIPVPSGIKKAIILQIALLALIPMLAILAARGISW